MREPLKRMGLYVTGLSLLLAAGPAGGQDRTSWQHDPASPGDWFDAANWTDGLPGADRDGYVDNAGTAVIDGSIYESFEIYVGDAGEGTVRQEGGTVTPDEIHLAEQAGSIGRYELLDGTLETSIDTYHSEGESTFVQEGGLASFHRARIGGNQSGKHRYLLEGGQLIGGVGAGTNGVFEQTGGMSKGMYAGVGARGEGAPGVFRLTAGTHTTTHRFSIGSYSREEEAPLLEVGGTGRFETSTLLVGDNAKGRVLQTGGECIVDELAIGQGYETPTYRLQEGLLSAGSIEVNGWSEPALLAQSGGTLDAGTVRVRSAGRVEFAGGRMSFNGGLLNEGTFEFAPSADVLHLAEGSMLDLSKGTIVNPGGGRIDAAASTLVMFPAGFDPDSELGSYSSAGVTHVAGSSSTVAATQNLTAFGEIEGHIRCEGSLEVPEDSKSLSITGGLEVAPGASVKLGEDGELTVEDTTSGISGGALSGKTLTVGGTGAASFSHGGGTTSLQGAGIGTGAGSQGTLTFTGGSLSAKSMTVGWEGTGEVVQTGGRIVLPGGSYTDSLWLGARGGRGSYELGGDGELVARTGVKVRNGDFALTGGRLEGSLRAKGYDDGTAQCEISGGVAELEGLGASENGEIVQTGGVVTVSESVGTGSGGRYVLDGPGELTANDGAIDGRFVQRDGALTVLNALRIGYEHKAEGLFELQGGDVDAGSTEIGVSPHQYTVPEAGLLAQSGGTHTTGILHIGQYGRYEYTGGRLTINELWRHEGEMDCQGADVTVTAGGGSLLDLRNGTIADGGSATLTAGPGSLALLPAAEPSGFFGTFTSEGSIHRPGETLTIPAESQFQLSGEFSDPVDCHGQLSAPAEKELKLTGGLQLHPGGAVNLREGHLIVPDTSSGMTGGQFKAHHLDVGDADGARFTQTDGNVELRWGLGVGNEEGTAGEYHLHGGTVNTYFFGVGAYDQGRFVQQGGAVEAGAHVALGGLMGEGHYLMQGGQLRGGPLYIGSKLEEKGTGHFIQSGGEVDVGGAYVRGSTPEGSSLEVSGGLFAAGVVEVTGSWPAVVRQSGGEIQLGTAENDRALVLADGHYETGRYELSGAARLETTAALIGDNGTADFRQAGGTFDVTRELRVGSWDESLGRLGLSGGELTAAKGYVGYYGSGEVRQQAGAALFGTLSLGERSRSYSPGHGSYTIEGGSLRAGIFRIGSVGRGEFTIASPDPQMTVIIDMTFGPNAEFSAVPGAAIHMDSAGLNNESTDPSALSGLRNLRMLFEGGRRAEPFEIAGADLGPEAAGLEANFALGTLQIGSAEHLGQLRLEDAFDNQTQRTGQEVLYVETLDVRPGSYLDLNGHTLYYFKGSVDPAAIVNTDGGQLVLVPEPATLALLGLAGLTLLRRRRT